MGSWITIRNTKSRSMMCQQGKNPHSLSSQESLVNRMRLENQRNKRTDHKRGRHSHSWFSPPASAGFHMGVSAPSCFSFTAPNSTKNMESSDRGGTKPITEYPEGCEYSSRGIWILPKPKVLWEIQYQKAKLRGS